MDRKNFRPISVLAELSRKVKNTANIRLSANVYRLISELFKPRPNCSNVKTNAIFLIKKKKIEYSFFGGFSADKNLAANSAIGYGLGL